tara:strand:+ start:282 stop:551 length:270 start_codon:yes stop_codon:yes gene_type:complete
MLIQINADAATQHAHFVLVSYCRLTTRLGQPVRQQRMLRPLGIEIWINLYMNRWQRSRRHKKKNALLVPIFFVARLLLKYKNIFSFQSF